MTPAGAWSVVGVEPQLAAPDDSWVVQTQLSQEQIDRRHDIIDNYESAGMPRRLADQWRGQLPGRSAVEVARQQLAGTGLAAVKGIVSLGNLPGTAADLGTSLIQDPLGTVVRGALTPIDYMRGDHAVSEHFAPAPPPFVPTQTDAYQKYVAGPIRRAEQYIDEALPSSVRLARARKAAHSAEVDEQEKDAPLGERLAAKAFSGVENVVRNPEDLLPSLAEQAAPMAAAIYGGPEVLLARASSVEARSLLEAAAKAQAAGDATLAASLTEQSARAAKLARVKAKAGVAGTFGLQTAQSSAAAVEADIRRLDDAQKRARSPDYAKLRDGGMSEPEATNALVARAVSIAEKTGFVVGMAGAHLVPGPAAGRLPFAAGLSASMTAQSAATKGGENLAEKLSGADPDLPLGSGVLESGVEGAVQSFGPTAVFSAIHKPAVTPGSARPGGSPAVPEAGRGELPPSAGGSQREPPGTPPPPAPRNLGSAGIEEGSEAPPAVSGQEPPGTADTAEPSPAFSRATRQEGYPTGASDPIASFTSAESLKVHPDYKAAKAGDAPAALRLVRDLVKPEHLDQARRQFGPGAIYVPALAREASGHNAIPDALARLYAHATSGMVTHEIAQVNEAHHTGAGQMERIAARPLFDGPVTPGGRYVLVDDVSTMGGTLAELADHIRAAGGKVEGSVLLANASRSATLAPHPQHVRLIEGRFGDEIRNRFNVEPAALTRDEARYLAGFQDADQLRGRADKAEGERARRLLSKGIGQEPLADQAPPSAGPLVSGEPPEFARGDALTDLPQARPGNAGQLAAALSRAHGRRITVEQVPPPDTAANALAAAVRRMFGRQVVFVRSSDAGLRGVHLGDKTLFVNADMEWPYAQVIGHELTHSIERENPEVYRSLLVALDGAINGPRATAFKQYLVERYRRDGLEPPAGGKLHGEVIADIVGDHFTDPRFIRELQKHLEPGLFRRLAAHILDLIDRIRGRLSGSRQEMGRQAARLVDDLEVTRKAVYRALREAAELDEAASGGANAAAFRQDEGRLRYLDKTKAGAWFTSIGRQLPKEKAVRRPGINLLTERDVFKRTPDALESPHVRALVWSGRNRPLAHEGSEPRRNIPATATASSSTNESAQNARRSVKSNPASEALADQTSHVKDTPSTQGGQFARVPGPNTLRLKRSPKFDADAKPAEQSAQTPAASEQVDHAGDEIQFSRGVQDAESRASGHVPSAPAGNSEPAMFSRNTGRVHATGREGVWALPSKLRTGASHVAVRITESGKRFFYGDSAGSAGDRAAAHDEGIDPGDREGLLRDPDRAQAYSAGVDGQLADTRDGLSRNALGLPQARRLQQAGGLRAREGSEGQCFAQSADRAEQGLGDMVLGIRSQKGETYWHAVVRLPDGTIFDPTANRSFKPGVYEQLGFEPKEVLTPREVRNFIADHGADFVFPAPHNLGLAGFEESREAQRARNARTGRTGETGREGIWALPSKLRTGASHVAVRITESGKRFFYGDSAGNAGERAAAHDEGIDPGDREGLLRVHAEAQTYSPGVDGVLEGTRQRLAHDALSAAEARRLQHTGALRARKGSEGECFLQSSERAEQGLGDMVLGIRSQKGETYWHAVIRLPDGTIFDPTANRSFKPGVYEQLGFEPKEVLTPREVRNFIADHGADFVFPAPHNLGLAGFEESREVRHSRSVAAGGADSGDGRERSVSTGALGARIKRMLPGGRARDRVTVLRSPAELPAEVRQRAQAVDDDADGRATAEGLFDPGTNRIYLFADHISVARAAWVLAHEGTHWGLHNLAESDSALRSTLQAARSNHVVRSLAVAIQSDPARARERLDDHQATSEALAELNAALRTRDWSELKQRYGLEVPESLKPALLDRVNHYVRQLAAALNRMIARALGRAPEAGEGFSDAQVRDLLHRSWRRMRQERDAPLPRTTERVAQALSRIAGGGDAACQRAATALRILTRNSDFFQYPISSSRDLGQIVLHTDRRMAVEQAERIDPQRALRYDVVRQWNVTMPDGAGAQVYETRKGRVFVDVSNLDEGGSGGSALYHAVANYAYNNGNVFVGDPAGLSDTALRRRTENMLNSALKFGTTRHLEPHERQLEGDADLGVEPLRWDESGTPAADAANLAHLLQRAHQNLLSAFPEAADLRYNFEHGRYEIQRGNGRSEPFGEAAFQLAATSAGGAREAGAGRRTLKRAAVINALLRGAGSPEWPGLLQKLSQRAGEVERLDLPLHGIGYSRNQTPPSAGSFVDGTESADSTHQSAARESAPRGGRGGIEDGGPSPAAESIPGVDASRDVPLAGGKSTTVDPVTGRKTTYIDRDMPRHVWVPGHDYKGKTTPGQWVNTHAEIHAHEEGEEPHLDARGYEAAHDGPGNDATRRYLAERGVDPHVYQNVIRPHLEAIREKAEQNRATDIPHDLDRRPYEDSGQGHLLRQDREIAADLHRDSGRTVAAGAPGPRPDSEPPALAGGGEPIGRFAELSGVHQSLRQVYRDAAALTGLHLDIDVVHGPVNMPADVPIRYSLGLRRIEVNPRYTMDRGRAAQFMAEELLHAVDHLGGRRTISAGSQRLAPDGDIGREAVRHFQGGGRYSGFLAYPLNEKMSDGRMRAELFARLGTLYFADPAGVKSLLPAAHGAFDEQFRLAGYKPDSAGTIQDKVWTGAGGLFQKSRGQRQVGPVVRGSDAGPDQRPADRLGQVSQGVVRGFRLGDLRNSISRSFGSPLGGGRVRLDDLEARIAVGHTGRGVEGAGWPQAAAGLEPVRSPPDAEAEPPDAEGDSGKRAPEQGAQSFPPRDSRMARSEGAAHGMGVGDHVGAGTPGGAVDSAERTLAHRARSFQTNESVRELPQFSRYSLASDGKAGGMSLEEVQSVVDEFKRDLGQNGGLDGLVFDVRPTVQAAVGSAGSGKRFKGGFYPRSGRVLLVASELSCRRDALATIRHEILSHYGLNLFDPPAKAAILRQIAQTRSNPLFKSLWREVDRSYAEQPESVRAGELFARAAESPRGPMRAWMDRLMSDLAGLLRRIGLAKGVLFPAELRQTAQSIADGIRRGARQRTFPQSDEAQFSRRGTPEKDDAPPSEGRIVSGGGAGSVGRAGAYASGTASKPQRTVELKTREEFRAASLEPRPNTAYKYDGFVYVTDERGRGISSSGVLRNDPGHRFYDDRKIARQGQKGDIAYHAGADRFGFQGGSLNVSPGNAKLNSREYKAFENELAKHVAAGNTVWVDFRRVFREGNSSSRPDEYHVYFKIGDGGIQERTFHNRPRG